MRKLFVFILTALLLTTPVLASSGPDSRSADPAACAHTFEVSVLREPTCVQKGLLAYTCSKCGLTYTAETLPDGSHDYALTGTTATCTEDGENTYTCVNCGDSYTEPAPAAGHISDSAATCTEGEVCAVCGEMLAPPIGHDYVYQFDAELAEDGSFLTYGTWMCANCGDVMAATQGNAAYYYGRETDPSEEDDAPAEAASVAEDSGTDLLLNEQILYSDDSPTDGAEAVPGQVKDAAPAPDQAEAAEPASDQAEDAAPASDQAEDTEPAPTIFKDRTELWIAISAVALVLIVVETVLLVRSLKKNKTTL